MLQSSVVSVYCVLLTAARPGNKCVKNTLCLAWSDAAFNFSHLFFAPQHSRSTEHALIIGRVSAARGNLTVMSTYPQSGHHPHQTVAPRCVCLHAIAVCDPYLLCREASKLTMLRFSRLAWWKEQREQRRSVNVPPVHEVRARGHLSPLGPPCGATYSGGLPCLSSALSDIYIKEGKETSSQDNMQKA